MDRRVRAFQTLSYLKAEQDWSPCSSLCTLIVLAQPWPSFLLIILKNSNCTQEMETKPIIKAANEISQNKETL